MSATDKSDRLPEPIDLRMAFAERHPVNWGDDLPTAAQLASKYGPDAARLSLTTLQRRLRTEQLTTRDFLSAVPDDATAYNLGSRVKSPMSLARQFQNRLERDTQGEPSDVLRFTVLCRTPGELAAAARSTVDELQASGWAVRSAMHSYTEGSRYKGLHADLLTPAGDVVELQFHSIASTKVKEATTRPYEIERSAAASDSARVAARALCVELSDTLATPPGLDDLRTLGGVPIDVNNYSDSRNQRASPEGHLRSTTTERQSQRQQATARQIDGTDR
jgi:hypothetical protein